MTKMETFGGGAICEHTLMQCWIGKFLDQNAINYEFWDGEILEYTGLAKKLWMNRKGPGNLYAFLPAPVICLFTLHHN